MNANVCFVETNEGGQTQEVEGISLPLESLCPGDSSCEDRS